MVKTASPTSSTRRTDRRSAQSGFTLVEIIIAFTLASFLMTGVMTTFLMMGRTGVLAQNYTELEVEARKALEMFSREARMACGVTAWGNSSVTLQIPDTTENRTGNSTGSYTVTYTFNTGNKTLTRTGPPITNPSGTSSTTTVVTNVTQIGTTDYIRYYKYDNTGYANGAQTNTASKIAEIKQIELNFIAQRTNNTVATSTDKVMSARFILRNK